MQRALSAALSVVLAIVTLGFVAPSANAEAAKAEGRIIAYISSDWKYGGFTKPIIVPDYGDCDSDGYRVTDTWGGSRFRQTSSISNTTISPSCNYAIIETVYGGRVGMRIPTAYIGDAANDQVYAIRFVKR